MGSGSEARRREAGFTLTELAVVVLIIAVLAAIVIPIFLHQKARAHDASAQSATKNAATAVESFAVEHNGGYAALDGLTGDDAELTGNGYKPTQGVDVVVTASNTAFCITATDTEGSALWSYASGVGKPEPVACTSVDG